ncbi:MAG: PEP-CTERM sorting domain-containing protein [Bryobacterales bacterium]|nr:PEP-CTERM sorting domain-containing protein [Bryobacterales bacterium]
MKRLIRLAMPMLAALILVAGASAASISFTDYVPGPSGNEFGTLNFTGTFVLPQFDASLGTLTGVTISYTSAWQGVSSNYTNEGDGEGEARLLGEFRSRVTNALLITQLQTIPVLYDTGLQVVASGASIGVSALSGSNGPTNANIIAALAAFIGNGNLNFDLVATLLVTNTFEGSFDGTQSAQGRGELTITYDYSEDDGGDPIPEPTTILLVGTALLGLGFLRRRG